MHIVIIGGGILGCSIAWHTREKVLLLVCDPERHAELEPFAGTSDGPGGVERAHVRLDEPREEPALRDEVGNLFARYATVVVLDRPGRARLGDGVAVDFVPDGSPRPDAAALALRAWAPAGSVTAAPDCIYDVPALGTADHAALHDGLLPTRSPAGRAVGRLAREVTGLKCHQCS